jgi:hypothetical protein
MKLTRKEKRKLWLIILCRINWKFSIKPQILFHIL